MLPAHKLRRFNENRNIKTNQHYKILKKITMNNDKILTAMFRRSS